MQTQLLCIISNLDPLKRRHYLKCTELLLNLRLIPIQPNSCDLTFEMFFTCKLSL